MRKITGHESNPINEAILITADNRDEANGNTSHVYDAEYTDQYERIRGSHIEFQHGPIKEVGFNGITNEALIAILIDRYEGFQASKWACVENGVTLRCLREAMQSQVLRTQGREKRGVEGTNEV